MADKKRRWSGLASVSQGEAGTIGECAALPSVPLDGVGSARQGGGGHVT
jgi:hypothetical protein